MHHDFGLGKPASHLQHLLHRETGVNETVTAPENQASLSNRILAVAAEGFARIPDDRFLTGDPHLVRGVPPQVLVGDEENLTAPVECPPESGSTVGGGADDPSPLSAKRLDRGVGIHIDDGDDGSLSADGRQLPPRLFHDGRVRHLGHPAPGFMVGYLNGLMGLAEDRRTFGHEMHPAENDVSGVAILGAFLCKGERIPPEVPQIHDLFALVMVGQNEEILPQGSFLLANPFQYFHSLRRNLHRLSLLWRPVRARGRIERSNLPSGAGKPPACPRNTPGQCSGKHEKLRRLPQRRRPHSG